MRRIANMAAIELLFGGLLLVAGLAITTRLMPAAEAGSGLSLAVYLALALLVWRGWRSNRPLGWPNRITLLRGLLLAWLAVWLMVPAWAGRGAWTIVVVVLGNLVLDGVDGYLARRLGQASSFGARFDMEVDAALMLLLCLLIAQADLAGPWVLLIGLLRYIFLGITTTWPDLNRPLPDRMRRKVICVWQVSSLILAFIPGLPGFLIEALLALALVLLVWSFAVDLAWLIRHRPGHNARQLKRT